MFDERYIAKALLKGKPNSSHTILKSEELSGNLALSQAYLANAMDIHSNAAYADIQMSGNKTRLIGLTFHSMTNLNCHMIMKNHETYNSGVKPIPEHIYSLNVTSVPRLDGSDLRILHQSNYG